MKKRKVIDAGLAEASTEGASNAHANLCNLQRLLTTAADDDTAAVTHLDIGRELLSMLPLNATNQHPAVKKLLLAVEFVQSALNDRVAPSCANEESETLQSSAPNVQSELDNRALALSHANDKSKMFQSFEFRLRSQSFHIHVPVGPFKTRGREVPESPSLPGLKEDCQRTITSFLTLQEALLLRSSHRLLHDGNYDAFGYSRLCWHPELQSSVLRELGRMSSENSNFLRALLRNESLNQEILNELMKTTLNNSFEPDVVPAVSMLLRDGRCDVDISMLHTVARKGRYDLAALFQAEKRLTHQAHMCVNCGDDVGCYTCVNQTYQPEWCCRRPVDESAEENHAQCRSCATEGLECSLCSQYLCQHCDPLCCTECSAILCYGGYCTEWTCETCENTLCTACANKEVPGHFYFDDEMINCAVCDPMPGIQAVTVSPCSLLGLQRKFKRKITSFLTLQEALLLRSSHRRLHNDHYDTFRYSCLCWNPELQIQHGVLGNMISENSNILPAFLKNDSLNPKTRNDLMCQILHAHRGPDVQHTMSRDMIAENSNVLSELLKNKSLNPKTLEDLMWQILHTAHFGPDVVPAVSMLLQDGRCDVDISMLHEVAREGRYDLAALFRADERLKDQVHMCVDCGRDVGCFTCVNQKHLVLLHWPCRRPVDESAEENHAQCRSCATGGLKCGSCSQYLCQHCDPLRCDECSAIICYSYFCAQTCNACKKTHCDECAKGKVPEDWRRDPDNGNIFICADCNPMPEF